MYSERTAENVEDIGLLEIAWVSLEILDYPSGYIDWISKLDK